MPCCMIAAPDRGNFGKVGRDGSITEIWQGEQYDTFCAALASDTPPEICRSCAVYRGTF